jgi:phenylalanyl-tRNA synthetase beta chain
MKISVQWLRELVDLGDMSVDAIARTLTMGGLEVEEVTPVAPAFSGIVVALVKSVAPHPDADKLRVTEVDAGTGEALQIVCGAPNVAAGQKVPCALVGAKLPALGDKAGFEIKRAKLRGVESNGMLCSARELGLSEDHGGLLVLEADAPVGRDVREALALDDIYLTLKLTPNRGDCLSMLGVARDLAALAGRELRASQPAAVAAKASDTRAIRISAPDACGAYFGRVIQGLDAHARTPQWMARRLERAGLRPIHPLVDITNYVMLERGQPMHAFDQAKLEGAIDVRFLAAGERVKLLNGETVDYRPDLLAITDARGPVALGGVMGGFDSMVTDATTAVFFESAFFHPEAVQGKARALALTSDAAYRFERGVDFAGSRAALERATALALEICGGSAGPITHAAGRSPLRDAIAVRPPRVRELLGYTVDDAKIRSILDRLWCKVDARGDKLAVVAPTWRFDLAIEEDYVEEVARVHGYDRVPSAPPRSGLRMVPVAEGQRTRFELRELLATLGYQEVVNYSFVSEESERDFAGNDHPVRLANPIAAQMSVMRTTLLGGLVATLRANLNRGEPRARLFEVGRVFDGSEARLDVQPEKVAGLAYGPRFPEQWGEKTAPVDFFDVKGDVEVLAGSRALAFEAASHPACHPGRCARVLLDGRPLGIVGELHPRLQQASELDRPPVVFELLTGPLLEGLPARFQGFSRMPVVRRDLSFLLAEKQPVGPVLQALREGVPAFVRHVEVFDQYRGQGIEPGQKSLALRIVMQDTDRTLTDSEVEAVMASMREKLLRQFQAKPRT